MPGGTGGRRADPKRRAQVVALRKSGYSINKTAELAGTVRPGGETDMGRGQLCRSEAARRVRGGRIDGSRCPAAVGRDERRGGKGMKKPNQDDEPFFITEEIAAEMIAGGYEFELPPIPCTIRLRDVLERMTDAELALQPGEIADRERERCRRKPCSTS